MADLVSDERPTGRSPQPDARRGCVAHVEARRGAGRRGGPRPHPGAARAQPGGGRGRDRAGGAARRVRRHGRGDTTTEVADQAPPRAPSHRPGDARGAAAIARARRARRVGGTIDRRPSRLATPRTGSRAVRRCNAGRARTVPVDLRSVLLRRRRDDHGRAAGGRVAPDAGGAGRAVRGASGRCAPADEGVRPATPGRAREHRVDASRRATLPAGHGLRTALRSVADDGSPPASQEFTRVLGEERLGRALDEAIAAMCERVGSADLEYVATAINVHSQTGGSLASLFDTLSETVRDRQRHARRVRALTSMGRMSASILICLPFGLAALMTLLDPPYMAPLFTTTGGHLLIGVCVTSMTIGGLVLKKIVNVRY